MFDGADDGGLIGPAERVEARWWAFLLFALGVAVLAILLACGLARAQTGQPNNCSGTATSSASTIAYPASGATGPNQPTKYVTIVNPSATATLWVNALPGGTAAANTAGSIPLGPNGGWVTWANPEYPPPLTISILSSAASSPYTCGYN